MALEPIVVEFCHPIMHMASCLNHISFIQKLMSMTEEQKVITVWSVWSDGLALDKNNLPENMEMDWTGEWVSSELVKNWNQNYQFQRWSLK